jgi:hypothetical protein
MSCVRPSIEKPTLRRRSSTGGALVNCGSGPETPRYRASACRAVITNGAAGLSGAGREASQKPTSSGLATTAASPRFSAGRTLLPLISILAGYGCRASISASSTRCARRSWKASHRKLSSITIEYPTQSRLMTIDVACLPWTRVAQASATRQRISGVK